MANQTVANAAARLALPAGSLEAGDVVWEGTTGKSYLYRGGSPSAAGSWLDRTTVTAPGGPITADQVEGLSAAIASAADARIEASRSSFNVRGFGAKLDGVYLSDAAMTAGSAVLTTATQFTAADVGKLVNVPAAGNPVSLGTISGTRVQGTAYTQVALTTALTEAISPGPLVLRQGTAQQIVSTTGADIGATAIPVASFTANAAYDAGTATLSKVTNLATTVQSVASGVPTLAAAAVVSVTSALACYGTDDTSAWNSTLAAAAVLGGGVVHPGGISLVTSTIVIPGAVVVSGQAIDYSSSVSGPTFAGGVGPGIPRRGSVIRAHGGFNPITDTVQLGTIAYPDTGWGESGRTAASLHRISIDGGGVARTAVRTIGARTRVSFCEFRNGNLYAADLSGQNGIWSHCTADNAAGGTASVFLNAHDIKIFGGEIRPGGRYELLISDQAGNSTVQHIDAFGPTASTRLNYPVGIITDSSWDGVEFIGCHLDNPTAGGSIVYVKVNSTTATLGGLAIVGCKAYSIVANAWFVLFDLPATGTTVRGFLFTGNQAIKSTGTFSGFVARRNGQGIIDNSVVTGNVGVELSNLFGGGFVPTYQDGNVWRKTDGTNCQSTQPSSSTFSGDGTTTSFTVAHAIGSIPSNVQLTPTTPAALGAYVSAKTATNFTVTFTTAPASGSSNVKFDWTARH